MAIDFDAANDTLAGKTADEIVAWALAQEGKPVVTTNFRPFEAVILHLVTQQKADTDVLWIDHLKNRPATYTFAEKVIGDLTLNVTKYTPLEDAPIPAAVEVPEDDRTPEQDEEIHQFSLKVKLEPFQRGMREMAPGVWFTALRRVQNANRDGMRIVEPGPNGEIKVNPLLEWSDAEMEAYLAKHDLPNEWDYFDPAKAGEKRECGLHNGKLAEVK